MPRILVTAGTIYGGDPPRPGPTAMVVDGERVAWLGSAGEVPRPIPRARVALGADSVVIPGFVDSHLHLVDLPLMSRWVDCRGVRTPEEAVRRLRRGANRFADGEWIAGWGYNAADAEAGRRADRTMLDQVSADRPVLLIESSLHQGAANSAALQAVGWGRRAPRAWGGEVERGRRGELTGMVWERAFSVLAVAARRASEDALGTDLGAAYREASRTLLEQGITHVGEALSARHHIERLGRANLDIGVTMFPSSSRHFYASPWDALDGPRTGEGDRQYGVGPLKLIADGAERCAISIPVATALRQTAAVLREGRRAPAGLRILAASRARLSGGRLRSGTLHYPPGGLTEIVAAALKKGFRTAIHALGNDAVKEALTAYEDARRTTGADLEGCRIEHAMFAEPRDLERAARLGLILSMQPGHAIQYAPTLRLTHVDSVFDPVPMRIAIDAGCRVAISSDGGTAPGTAMDNMRGAVDRMAVDGRPIRADLAITPSEALRAATVGGAEALGLARVKGSLAPGMQADFAVLSGHPFDPATEVRETWLRGVRVFGPSGG